MIKILALIKLPFTSGRFSRKSLTSPRIMLMAGVFLNVLIHDPTHEAVGEQILRITVRMSLESSYRLKYVANLTRPRLRATSYASGKVRRVVPTSQ